MQHDVLPFQNYYQIKPELPHDNDSLTEQQIQNILKYTSAPIHIHKNGFRNIEPPEGEEFQILLLTSGSLEVTMINDYALELYCWEVHAPYLIVSLRGDYCSFMHKALENSVLYPCSPELLSNSELSKELYRTTLFGFSHRLQIVLMNMFSMKNDNTPCRIYKYLYQLAYNQSLHTPSEGSDVLTAKLPSQEKIAKITNTHRSSIVKCMHHLCEMGILEKKEKKQITILSMKALLKQINHEQERSSEKD